MTVAVDDTNATVDAALKLGGRVVVLAYDAGGVARVAELGDPQGAELTVSRYQPG